MNKNYVLIIYKSWFITVQIMYIYDTTKNTWSYNLKKYCMLDFEVLYMYLHVMVEVYTHSNVQPHIYYWYPCNWVYCVIFIDTCFCNMKQMYSPQTYYIRVEIFCWYNSYVSVEFNVFCRELNNHLDFWWFTRS